METFKSCLTVALAEKKKVSPHLRAWEEQQTRYQYLERRVRQMCV